MRIQLLLITFKITTTTSCWSDTCRLATKMPTKNHCRGLAIIRCCFSQWLGWQIADDKQDVRKVTATEAPDSLDAVKCFAEIHGDKQLNVLPNELIRKMETLKSQNVRQSRKLTQSTQNIVRFLSMMFFLSEKLQNSITDTSL